MLPGLADPQSIASPVSSSAPSWTSATAWPWVSSERDQRRQVRADAAAVDPRVVRDEDPHQRLTSLAQTPSMVQTSKAGIQWLRHEAQIRRSSRPMSVAVKPRPAQIGGMKLHEGRHASEDK